MDRDETGIEINPEEKSGGGRRPARRAAARNDSAADLWLGQQIRALRKAQKLSLAQLAERTDLSIGNLSQIERGVRSPSVRSLQRLSECLKVPVADLFQTRALPPAAELGTILRRKARPILNLSKSGCHKELLTPMMPGTLQLLLVTLDPQSIGEADVNPNPMTWTRKVEGGRVFYTAMGHTKESYSEPWFLNQLAEGLDWVLGGK